MFDLASFIIGLSAGLVIAYFIILIAEKLDLI